MRLVTFTFAGALALSVAGLAADATATDSSGTTLSVQAGVTSGDMDVTGAALGATVVQDVGSRVSIEAAASYLGQGMGSGSLTASASVLLNLRRSGQKAVPYLSLGGGLYRTAFDMSDRYFGAGGMRGGAGMMGQAMMGSGYGRAHPSSSTVPSDAYMYGHMSPFYRSRFPEGMGPGTDMRGHRSFTDPALTVGAGVKIDIGHDLFVRPDGRALIVMSGGDATMVGVLAVNFGWRF